MTREEAAEKALNGYDIDGRCLDPSQVFIDGFCEGAEWADGNRWISVKDQLPQMHVLVLCRYVWGENKGFMLTRRTNFTPNALDPNGFDTQEREPPFTYLKVTHWMEIPLINCNDPKSSNPNVATLGLNIRRYVATFVQRAYVFRREIYAKNRTELREFA